MASTPLSRFISPPSVRAVPGSNSTRFGLQAMAFWQTEELAKNDLHARNWARETGPRTRTRDAETAGSPNGESIFSHLVSSHVGYLAVKSQMGSSVNLVCVGHEHR